MQIKTARRRLVLPVRALGVVVAVGVGLAAATRSEPGAALLERAREAGRSGLNFAVARVMAQPAMLRIDLSHPNFEKLARKRQQALEAGILESSPEDFVPGTLHAEGREVRVKLRLKGDMADHWEDTSKWSFRIVVKDDETVFGMKRFSVQHPGTRGYLREWLMHRALAREGLPALRYQFVALTLNGKDLGIYALEEHFEKRLVENARRREGPILRFDEDLCWAEVRREPGIARAVTCGGSGSGAYLAAGVDAFQTTRLMADAGSAGQFVAAAHLLEGFRGGRLAASEVFDTELMARSLAVLEVLDRLHAAFWRNARFYYNPISGRLEPIAFDGGGDAQPEMEALAPALSRVYDSGDPNAGAYHLSYIDTLFRDDAFYDSYVRALERISDPVWLDALLADAGDDARDALRVVHLEYPGVRFDEAFLRERQRRVRDWLEPPKVLHAHVEGTVDGTFTFAVGNLQYLDAEVLGLAGPNGFDVPLPTPHRLPGRHPRHPVAYERIRLTLPAGAPEPAELVVRHRLRGAEKERRARLFAWAQADATAVRRDLTRAAPTYASFDFVSVDEAARVLRVQPGLWFVDRDLVVPPGWTFRAGADTQIVLESGAAIVSRSPVELVGREDAPVVVRSASGSGAGLVVLQADGLSRLEHVRFERLGAPVRAGLALTGAVTFYESPVAIAHAHFVDCRAEDALNVIRSGFEIRETVFRDAASDALDLDFAEGSLVDVAFVASGNDALDLSGSHVRLERLRVDGAGDKGVSAGERSRAEGVSVLIRGAGVGIASKDMASIELEGLRIEQSAVGLAVYRKKPEFGGAFLGVTGLELVEVERPFLRERGSTLRVDGRDVGSEETAVAERLESGATP